MASMHPFGNALHSRHIRSAYQRRQEAKKDTQTNVLQRSRSSQARLENMNQHKEHEQHEHHHHQHHHKENIERHPLSTLEHLKRLKVHEKPIFALSLEHERLALGQLTLPTSPRREHRHWLSAPELGVDSSQRAVVQSPPPTPGWKLEFGSFDFRSTGIRNGFVDAMQTFANAPTA
ncbi:unnamed protein product [Bursaphelenchus xylophilus]|uniref:(pine wood nematode) hypothetical protein n=1 Tax=Bursaphelenchus xylophilus TaxID=6326 RepID=A0A1I7RJZ3_BURXY|nr:unnamed protein product [Bursaphelenchus xylophilus]CAG9131621.1 unnamed protein product [Bursaphelenchus xylophilus]